MFLLKTYYLDYSKVFAQLYLKRLYWIGLTFFKICVNEQFCNFQRGYNGYKPCFHLLTTAKAV